MTFISIILSGYLYFINITKYNYILNRINYDDEITDEKNKNFNSNINIEIPDIQNKNYNELDEEK